MNISFRHQQPLRHPMRQVTLLALFLAVLPLFSAHAEWTQQVITLRPGWNAVWLEVTPLVNDSETVFQSQPVKSVWRYYSEEASPRYIDDATSQGVKPDPERWLTWMPGQPSGSVLKSLQKIHGGTAYLIESQGTGNVTWTVTGKAVVENLSWLNASYSLTGLCVDPANPVTFAQFFTGSTAHLNANIRRIQADGSWATIPTSTQIQRGEAYWIFSNGISSFQGQGSVEVDDKGLLDFGSTVVEQSVTLCNNTTSNASFTLSVLGATPPAGVLTGGAVQLSLWRDGSSLTYGWEIMNGAKTLTVLANTKKVVRLAIRRADMPGQGTDRPFHSILRVAGLNMCSNIGVVADGYAAGGGGGGVASRNAGLWVGQCVLRNVNEPAGANPNTLQPTATEASLRLLLRVAANGSVSLVREATILWLDGLKDVNGNVTEAGRYLVAASDAELAQYQSTYGAVGTGRLKGATVRDGKAAARRISSVGFSFTTPQAMSGTFNPSTGVIAGTVTIGYDDDLNPYKHRYHPDHDNMDSRYASKLPEGQENFTISRQITLTFQATDPENLRLPGWGDTLAGGLYSETVTGLHRTPVKVSGTFLLTKVVAQ